MSDRLWVLGAPDPEMTVIEGLLHEAGERVVHATDERGERVHPGGAYRMRPLDEDLVPWGGTLYLVECDVASSWPTDALRVVRVDHHRPGDPGHGRPPEQIQAFMRVWAPAHGLVGIYGDPQRGVAGGYVARDPAPALTASHPGPR